MPFHLDQMRRQSELAELHAVAAARAIGGTVSIDDLARLRSQLATHDGPVLIDASDQDVLQLQTLLSGLAGLKIVDGSAAASLDGAVLVSTSNEPEAVLHARIGSGQPSRVFRVGAAPDSALPPSANPPLHDRKLHIVILNDFGFQGRTGEAMRRQALAFLLNGWDVTVVCWTTEAHLRALSISGVGIDSRWRGYSGLYRVYPRSDSQALFVADVVQVVRQQKPDLVVVGRLDGVPFPDGVVERIRSLGIAVLPYMHNRNLPEALPASQAIGFGIDAALFAPLPRATARRLLGIVDDRPLVVMRAVAPGDAHHDADLFEEMRSALIRRSDVGLILYGPESHLMKSTRSFGPVPQALMPLIFSAADIFVSTNVAETIGDATCEAMACGLPVVAMRAGPIEDLIVDGQTGLLVGPPMAAGLLTCVQRLQADAELRRTMGEAGRRRVEERFTLRRLAQAWSDALPLLPAGDPPR